MLAVREVQVHLELKVDFAQGLFHLREKQSPREVRGQVRSKWELSRLLPGRRDGPSAGGRRCRVTADRPRVGPGFR